jgi:Ca2+-binding RTX toxin-like protein
MVAIALPRIGRALVVALALLLMAPIVASALGRNGGSSGTDRQVAKLLRLDPGSRLGANTQVVAADGAQLLGVPGRTNFMLGLGARQRIVGGAEHDQLGVRGAAGRVLGRGGPDLIHGGPMDDQLSGGAGPDLINGGPGHDLLSGGPGRDRLIDGRGTTTVRAGAGRDLIDVADGSGDDRVQCTPGSRDRVEADAGDQVGRGCRVVRARINARRVEARGAQLVTGDGSNDKPYVMDCGDLTRVDCAIGPFPRRTLNGFWANEFVPAYKCPPAHPYLFSQDYAPWGTSLPRGVEVRGLKTGNVGVSMTGTSTIKVEGRDGRYPTGALTGPGQSSATSWTGGEAIYQVILHCTSDLDHSYNLRGQIL